MRVRLQSNELKKTLRNKIRVDKTYLFKVMHKVDCVWNKFFAQCYKYGDCLENIDFNLLNFETQVSKILNGELVIDVIPSFFRQLTKEEEPKDKRKSETEIMNPPTKKTKKIVHKGEPNPAWCIKEGEEFNHMFFHKDQKMKPRGVCLKYHINKECVKGCSKGRSHHKLDEAQKKALTEFVANCRKNEK